MSRSLLILALILTVACGDTSMPVPESPVVPDVTLGQIASAQWDSLAAKRVLFGHQSVGTNVIEGITELHAAGVARQIALLEPGAVGPGLLHAKIGVNGDPSSKLEAFRSLVGTSRPDVAIMKFCYLDVTGDRSADSLFADYRARMTELRTQHPGLVLVHTTMPLTDDGNWKERLVKTIKRRPTARELNAIRNRYNSLLRQAFAGREPIIDIAAIESMRPDGTRSAIGSGTSSVYFLAPELTDDGGHLNVAGRRAVAERFLAVLATLD